MARGLVLLGLALFAGHGAAAGTPITVATWNVENYLAEDRLVDGAYRPAYPKPETAKAALRGAIREMDPDVLALQEMGPEPYLAELQRDLGSEGQPYPYRAWVDGPDPERHVALLSRVPLREVRPHARLLHRGANGPDPVCRGVLEVTIGAGDDGAATLFILHLKSRYTTDPGDPESARQRAGEAEAVRDLVLTRFPDPARARFLVVGDCNDVPGSRPLRALTRRGELEIARLLPAEDRDGDLWTHCYRKAATYTRVDYILVSPGLVPAVERMWIHDSPAVRAASDHRPVLVRLGWRAE